MNRNHYWTQDNKLYQRHTTLGNNLTEETTCVGQIIYNETTDTYYFKRKWWVTILAEDTIRKIYEKIIDLRTNKDLQDEEFPINELPL